MTTASAGSPQGRDPERGSIGEADNIAVGAADAPDTTDTTPPKPSQAAREIVTQADRIAASAILISREAEQHAIDGKLDHNPVVQAFARHRIAAERDLGGVDRDGLRPEVLAFAHLMERQLRANDHKPGWKDDLADDLLSRMREETEELERAVFRDGKRRAWGDGWVMEDTVPRVGQEAADVANFAMMVADVCGALTALPSAPVQAPTLTSSILERIDRARKCPYDGTIHEGRKLRVEYITIRVEDFDALRSALQSSQLSTPVQATGGDAELRKAGRNLVPYLDWTIGLESPGHHPTMPSAVAEFKAALKPFASAQAVDGVEALFTGHDRMDREGLDRWRTLAEQTYGHDLMPINANSVRRIISSLDAAVAALSAPQPSEPGDAA